MFWPRKNVIFNLFLKLREAKCTKRSFVLSKIRFFAAKLRFAILTAFYYVNVDAKRIKDEKRNKRAKRSFDSKSKMYLKRSCASCFYLRFRSSSRFASAEHFGPGLCITFISFLSISNNLNFAKIE